MGTRGAWGFYRDGETKATYNHYDSYPSGLGSDIVNVLAETNNDELNEIFDRLKLVNSESTPTNEQIDECIKFFNGSVSTGQTTEWYALLREAQGSLQALKDGLDYMIDDKNFLRDSLFCEWGYIVNLDSNKLEVYRGFQKVADKNRYYHPSVDQEDYKNCRLIVEIPLEQCKIFKNDSEVFEEYVYTYAGD